MTHNRLNVLVISDPHAHARDPLASDSPSYYSTDSKYRTAQLHPFVGLAQQIKAEGLKVDWIFAPGDLGDKADATAQKAAWDDLEEVRRSLGATLLFGTVGNHDVDSRRKIAEFDPKGTLQALVPTFPTKFACFEDDDKVFSDRYWSRNFVKIDFTDLSTKLIIINSSAFHGYQSENDKVPAEHLHGRISPITLDLIRKQLGSPAAINIVLLHHHVRTHPWIKDGGSLAIGADRLLEMLKATDHQWIIVHGHQHVPHLSYADATPFAPVILSSGSVAAKTYQVQGGFPRNQMHLLSIDIDQSVANGSLPYGEVTSWSWTPEVGWGRAKSDAGLPFSCGFGFRPNFLELRDQLYAQASRGKDGLAKWTDLISSEQRLSFLVPEDMTGLLTLLRKKGARLQFNDDHQLSYVEVAR